MTPAPKSARASKPTAGQKAKAAFDAHKTVARNRKATHDYFIEDRYEAGLVLTGTEVKALRMGRASLSEAWARSACTAVRAREPLHWKHD